MKEIQERLKIYKEILFWYRMSNIPIISYFIEDTKFGFCHYISQNYIYWSIIDDFSELYQQKPKGAIAWWFAQGLIKPRIKCLKEAIKLCEEKLKSY